MRNQRSCINTSVIVTLLLAMTWLTAGCGERSPVAPGQETHQEPHMAPARESEMRINLVPTEAKLENIDVNKEAVVADGVETTIWSLAPLNPNPIEILMMPFHLSITGETQGNISEGACEIIGREDTILCQALEHEVSIPRNLQNGLPTGKRVHGVLKITKVFDKSSPKLYQALTTGERLDEVKLEFRRINPTTGNEEHYFTIKLANAITVSVRPWVPNALDPEQTTLTHMEDVSFTYQDIVWTWEIDGIEAQDSFLVAV